MKSNLLSFNYDNFFYYRPTFNNSCGAACLLMAAYSLNINFLPELKVAKRNAFIKGEIIGGIQLRLSEECEKYLYYISSGSSLSENTKTYNELNRVNGEISLPHNIAFAARLIGLNVEINMKSLLPHIINMLYPNVKSKCLDSNIPVKNIFYNHNLKQNERRLRIVLIKKERFALHYILENPTLNNYRFMDPGDWIQNGNSNQPHCSDVFPSSVFIDSGISIVLKK